MHRESQGVPDALASAQGDGGAGRRNAAARTSPGSPTATGGSSALAKDSDESPPTGRPIRRRAYLSSHREHRVCARFSADEYSAVRKAAAQAGLTSAGFIGELALASVRATAVPAPLSLSGQHSALAEELTALRTALARVGNNLNQIARVLNSGVVADSDTDIMCLLDTSLGCLVSVMTTIDTAAHHVASR